MLLLTDKPPFSPTTRNDFQFHCRSQTNFKMFVDNDNSSLATNKMPILNPFHFKLIYL